MSRIVPSKPAAEEVFYVRAIQSYKARKKGELSFKIDQIIEVRETNTSEYLHFGVLDGKEGITQSNLYYQTKKIHKNFFFKILGWFPYFYVKLDKKDNFENQKVFINNHQSKYMKIKFYKINKKVGKRNKAEKTKFNEIKSREKIERHYNKKWNGWEKNRKTI